MELIENSEIDEKSVGYQLAQSLMKGSWKDIAKLLQTVTDSDVEGVRRVVLNYYAKVLLNGSERGAEIIEEFENNFFDSGKAGLYKAFWDCKD